MEYALILMVFLLATFIALVFLMFVVWHRLNEQTSQARSHIVAYRAQVETLKELEKQGLQNWNKPND